MTSDRGNTGAAEMHLPNTPVTPKTTNLNPNATEFQSIKGPATPPDSATEGGWSPPDFEATSARPVESLTYVNGEADQPLPTNINFPPTPESPPMVADYTEGPTGGAPAVEVGSEGANTKSGEVAVTAAGGGSGLEAQVLFPSAPASHTEEGSTSPTVSADENILEGSLPDGQLRAMLKHQLEYYFSRENLAQDSYLVSQMDADQFVPISTIAKFNQVKKLTSNLDLVVDVLRESTNVQVDEKGEKVRPLHQRCVVILREVPETTPVQDVEQLFSGANCPKFVSCEFASGNCWYITFDSEEDAQRAYQYLREEVQTFLGKPIMARIKAKPILRTYGPKNMYKVTGGAGGTPVSATAQATPAGAGVTSPTTPQQLLSPQQPDVFSPPQQPPQQQPAKMAAYPTPAPPQQPVAAASAASMQSVPFISSPQQTTPVSLPFFPPSNNVWSQHMAFLEPSMAFAMNGYTPTGTFKLPNASNKHQQQHTHTYQTVRNSQQSYRNQKPTRYGQPPAATVAPQQATAQQQPPPPTPQLPQQPVPQQQQVQPHLTLPTAMNSNNTTNQTTTPITGQLQPGMQPQQPPAVTGGNLQHPQQPQPALTHHTQALQQPTMTAVQLNSAAAPVTVATMTQAPAPIVPQSHTHVSSMITPTGGENSSNIEGAATVSVSSNTGTATGMGSGVSGNTVAQPPQQQRSTVSVNNLQSVGSGGNNNAIINNERNTLPAASGGGVVMNGGTGTGHSRVSPRGMNINSGAGYENVVHANFSGQHSMYGGVGGSSGNPMRGPRSEMFHHQQHHQNHHSGVGNGNNGGSSGPPPQSQQARGDGYHHHHHHHHHSHHQAPPPAPHHHNHHGNHYHHHHSNSYHSSHQSNTSNHSHSNSYHHGSDATGPSAGHPGHSHPRYGGSGSHGSSSSSHNHAEASVKEIPPRHQRNRERESERRQEERRPDRRSEEGRGGERDERRDRDYFRNRRRQRMEEGDGTKRNPVSAKDRIPESFELEANSFPPLPGSQNNTSSNGVFESKMSDVVKGCAKSTGVSTATTVKESTSKAATSKAAEITKETVSVSATVTPAEMGGKRRSSTPPATNAGHQAGPQGSTSTTVGTAAELVVSVAMTTTSSTPPTPPLSPQKVNKAITAKPANSQKSVGAETSSASAAPPSSQPPVKSEPSTSQSKVDTQPKTRGHPAAKMEKEGTPSDKSTGTAPAPGNPPPLSASKMSYASVVSKANLTNGEMPLPEKPESQSTANSNTGPSKIDGTANATGSSNNSAEHLGSSFVAAATTPSTSAAPSTGHQDGGKKSPTREVNSYRRERENDRRGSDRDDGYQRQPPRDRYDGPKDQRPSFGGGRRGGYRRDRGDRDSYNSSAGNRGDKEFYGNRNSGDSYSRGGYRGNRMDRDSFQRDRRKDDRIVVKE